MSESIDDVLAHFGVKGMKWGQRRSRAERIAARSAPSEVTVKASPARRGAQEIKVRNKAGRGASAIGGKRNLASEDAIVAKVGRAKARASSTDALSNKELKTVVERMNLEQQYAKLEKNRPAKQKGSEFVAKIMQDQGPQLLEALLKK